MDVHYPPCAFLFMAFSLRYYYMRVVRRFKGGGVLDVDVGGYPGLILGHVPLAISYMLDRRWPLASFH